MSKPSALCIRPVARGDRSEWLRMRQTLWPDSHGEEIDGFFAKADAGADPLKQAAVFVAERAEGGLGGFVELGARAYAEGCETAPVAYVEGWHVDADLRRQGVGAALIAAGEDWARSKGFTEIANDALTDNTTSIAAHKALFYREIERIACFAKQLA